ncbi:MAG: hypothetical protein ACQRW7_12265 [Caulobacterales bacterium]|uniref:hypothetical protein n=1 Tax=Glycocaulis sp. TaxID=1969725 RepID=UPI003F9FC0B0
MIRRLVIPANGEEAALLDRLVASFTEELAARTKECMFYMTEPGAGDCARIIETETQETLDRFLSFVAAHIGHHAF